MEFKVSFIGESGRQSIAYDVPEGAVLRVSESPGTAPMIWGNSAGLLVLANIMSAIANNRCPNGFHLHLRKDFPGDGNDPDILTIGVSNNIKEDARS